MVVNVGHRIREARLSAGLRREDVAVRLDVGMATVLRWETGKTTPSLRMLARIADLTEKPLTFFVTDEVAA